MLAEYALTWGIGDGAVLPDWPASSTLCFARRCLSVLPPDSALFKPYEEFMGKRWLREITDLSGGRTVPVDSLDELPEAAAAISRELRQQYVLGYSPTHTAASGEWHKVKVQILSSTTEHPLTPAYKKGYYAERSRRLVQLLARVCNADNEIQSC